MPKVTTDKNLKTELAKAKKEIIALKKELKTNQAQCLKEMGLLVEDAFITGYTEALDDTDRKNIAMEKFMNQALAKFDKEYEDKLVNEVKVRTTKKAKPAKKAVKKPAKKAVKRK